MTASYWQLDAGWRDRWVDTAIPRQVDHAIIGAGLGVRAVIAVHTTGARG